MPPSSGDKKKQPDELNRLVSGLIGCAVWIAGIVLYLYLLTWLAPEAQPRGRGVISLGIAALLFFIVWTRPLVVREMKYHPYLEPMVNENDPDDRTGEAYVAVIGFFCALYGLYAIFS